MILTDHLVQTTALGLREAGHMEGEAGAVSESFGDGVSVRRRQKPILS
jgi:hypothetical protein